MEFPKGKKYSIIYSDPPWAYRDRRDKHPRLCGGASAHYKTMKTDEIMQLPVEEIAADERQEIELSSYAGICRELSFLRGRGCPDGIVGGWEYDRKASMSSATTVST